MSTVASLAMKISADATGVKESLTPVERAFQQLDKEAAKVTDSFNDFAGESVAAALAQRDAQAAIDQLTASLRSGAINGKQFADEFAKLGESVNEQAAAFRRAAQITEASITPQQKYNRTVSELRAEVAAGRITQDTFNQAMAKAKGELDKATGSAKSAKSELAGVSKSLSTIAAIEIGRVVVDGFQAVANVFSRVSSQVASLVSSVNSSIDTLVDFSARTGIGVEALQGYSLAAKLAGVDTEAFGAAVQKLGVNIGKANPGDSFDKSLRAIGLSVAELRALAPEEQFSAIGNAISELPTAADRAAAAVEVFGKQGAALAPLFREGAASIEELRARAERLGVIVSETQVNNVGDMNDAFDLVSATVQGIVGQVIGNLAPAVTAVVDEFLKFVETWEGASGTGGTGIANAITETLLKGAEFFAGIFDSFVTNFESISSILADVGEVFRIGGQLLLTGMEGFRAVFNVIQLGIDALLIGFGKLLEGIGSWVSDDLEQFGAGLAAASEESAKKNTEEMEAAAKNAANAFAGIFGQVGGSAEKGGQGAAVQFVKGISDRIRQEQSPEFKIETNLDQTEERLKLFLKNSTDGGSDFLKQSTETLATFQQMAGEGELTAEQIKIMNGFMEKLNQELDGELEKRKAAKDAADAQAEADQKRVDALLKVGDAANKIEEDLAAVERKRQQVAASGDADAQAQLARLDELRAQLDEQQQAQDQGFGDGFQKAFDDSKKTLDDAIDKSKEFGQAGFDAALQLQEGIKAAQAQVKDGILSKEAYDNEVNRQQELFDKRIDDEKKVMDERKKAQEEAAKLREQQEKTVNDLIKQQEFGGDDARVKAAENLKAIEAEIARAKEAQAEARKNDDKGAADAATKRLAQLDQVQAKERDIASGVAAQREAFQKKQQELVAAQAKQQEQIAQQQQKFAEEQAKAQQAEFERQSKRIAELNTLGPQTVQTADVRTQAGQQIVLDLFNQQQDPALIQAKLTNKVLNRIAASIDRDLNRLGQPALILP